MIERDAAEAETIERDRGNFDLVLRAETINADDRTVRATIVTENPVFEYDFRAGEMVDGVILVDAMQPVDRDAIPMFESHNTYDLGSLIGSVRDIRQENGELAGTLHFAMDDPKADRIWRMIEQGHINDVSVGARPLAYERLARGESKQVNGKTYTARNDRPMRIVTDWVLREVSVVGIGADRAAKMREDMTSSANKNERGNNMEPDETKDGATETERQETAPAEKVERTEAPPVAPVAAPAPAPDVSNVVREQFKAETQRRQGIENLAGEYVSRELVDRALNDGWTVERAGHAFMQAINDAQTNPTPGAPAIVVRSHETECNRETLQIALLQRAGLYKHEAGSEADHKAEIAERFATYSLVEVCREICRYENHSYVTREDMIRRAMSGGSMSGLFLNVSNQALAAAFTERS